MEFNTSDEEEEVDNEPQNPASRQSDRVPYYRQLAINHIDLLNLFGSSDEEEEPPDNLEVAEEEQDVIDPSLIVDSSIKAPSFQTVNGHSRVHQVFKRKVASESSCLVSPGPLPMSNLSAISSSIATDVQTPKTTTLEKSLVVRRYKNNIAQEYPLAESNDSFCTADNNMSVLARRQKEEENNRMEDSFTRHNKLVIEPAIPSQTPNQKTNLRPEHTNNFRRKNDRKTWVTTIQTTKKQKDSHPNHEVHQSDSSLNNSISGFNFTGNSASQQNNLHLYKVQKNIILKEPVISENIGAGGSRVSSKFSNNMFCHHQNFTDKSSSLSIVDIGLGQKISSVDSENLSCSEQAQTPTQHNQETVTASKEPGSKEATKYTSEINRMMAQVEMCLGILDNNSEIKSQGVSSMSPVQNQEGVQTRLESQNSYLNDKVLCTSNYKSPDMTSLESSVDNRQPRERDAPLCLESSSVETDSLERLNTTEFSESRQLVDENAIAVAQNVDKRCPSSKTSEIPLNNHQNLIDASMERDGQEIIAESNGYRSRISDSSKSTGFPFNGQHQNFIDSSMSIERYQEGAHGATAENNEVSPSRTAAVVVSNSTIQSDVTISSNNQTLTSDLSRMMDSVNYCLSLIDNFSSSNDHSAPSSQNRQRTEHNSQTQYRSVLNEDQDFDASSYFSSKLKEISNQSNFSLRCDHGGFAATLNQYSDHGILEDKRTTTKRSTVNVGALVETYEKHSHETQPIPSPSATTSRKRQKPKFNPKHSYSQATKISSQLSSKLKENSVQSNPSLILNKSGYSKISEDKKTTSNAANDGVNESYISEHPIQNFQKQNEHSLTTSDVKCNKTAHVSYHNVADEIEVNSLNSYIGMKKTRGDLGSGNESTVTENVSEQNCLGSKQLPHESKENKLLAESESEKSHHESTTVPHVSKFDTKSTSSLATGRSELASTSGYYSVTSSATNRTNNTNNVKIFKKKKLDAEWSCASSQDRHRQKITKSHAFTLGISKSDHELHKSKNRRVNQLLVTYERVTPIIPTFSDHRVFKTDFESFQSCSEAIENIKLQKDMVNKLNILIRLNNKPKSCSSSHVTGVNSCDKLIDNSDKFSHHTATVSTGVKSECPLVSAPRKSDLKIWKEESRTSVKSSKQLFSSFLESLKLSSTSLEPKHPEKNTLQELMSCFHQSSTPYRNKHETFNDKEKNFETPVFIENFNGHSIFDSSISSNPFEFYLRNLLETASNKSLGSYTGKQSSSKLSDVSFSDEVFKFPEIIQEENGSIDSKSAVTTSSHLFANDEIEEMFQLQGYTVEEKDFIKVLFEGLETVNIISLSQDNLQSDEKRNPNMNQLVDNVSSKENLTSEYMSLKDNISKETNFQSEVSEDVITVKYFEITQSSSKHTIKEKSNVSEPEPEDDYLFEEVFEIGEEEDDLLADVLKELDLKYKNQEKSVEEPSTSGPTITSKYSKVSPNTSQEKNSKTYLTKVSICDIRNNSHFTTSRENHESEQQYGLEQVSTKEEVFVREIYDEIDSKISIISHQNKQDVVPEKGFIEYKVSDGEFYDKIDSKTSQESHENGQSNVLENVCIKEDVSVSEIYYETCSSISQTKHESEHKFAFEKEASVGVLPFLNSYKMDSKISSKSNENEEGESISEEACSKENASISEEKCKINYKIPQEINENLQNNDLKKVCTEEEIFVTEIDDEMDSIISQKNNESEQKFLLEKVCIEKEISVGEVSYKIGSKISQESNESQQHNDLENVCIKKEVSTSKIYGEMGSTMPQKSHESEHKFAFEKEASVGVLPLAYLLLKSYQMDSKISQENNENEEGERISEDVCSKDVSISEIKYKTNSKLSQETNKNQQHNDLENVCIKEEVFVSEIYDEMDSIMCQRSHESEEKFIFEKVCIEREACDSNVSNKMESNTSQENYENGRNFELEKVCIEKEASDRKLYDVIDSKISKESHKNEQNNFSEKLCITEDVSVSKMYDEMNSITSQKSHENEHKFIFEKLFVEKEACDSNVSDKLESNTSQESLENGQNFVLEKVCIDRDISFGEVSYKIDSKLSQESNESGEGESMSEEVCSEEDASISELKCKINSKFSQKANENQQNNDLEKMCIKEKVFLSESYGEMDFIIFQKSLENGQTFELEKVCVEKEVSDSEICDEENSKLSKESYENKQNNDFEKVCIKEEVSINKRYDEMHSTISQKTHENEQIFVLEKVRIVNKIFDGEVSYKVDSKISPESNKNGEGENLSEEICSKKYASTSEEKSKTNSKLSQILTNESLKNNVFENVCTKEEVSICGIRDEMDSTIPQKSNESEHKLAVENEASVGVLLLAYLMLTSYQMDSKVSPKSNENKEDSILEEFCPKEDDSISEINYKIDSKISQKTNENLKTNVLEKVCIKKEIYDEMDSILSQKSQESEQKSLLENVCMDKEATVGEKTYKNVSTISQESKFYQGISVEVCSKEDTFMNEEKCKTESKLSRESNKNQLNNVLEKVYIKEEVSGSEIHDEIDSKIAKENSQNDRRNESLDKVFLEEIFVNETNHLHDSYFSKENYQTKANIATPEIEYKNYKTENETETEEYISATAGEETCSKITHDDVNDKNEFLKETESEFPMSSKSNLRSESSTVSRNMNTSNPSLTDGNCVNDFMSCIESSSGENSVVEEVPEVIKTLGHDTVQYYEYIKCPSVLSSVSFKIFNTVKPFRANKKEEISNKSSLEKSRECSYEAESDIMLNGELDVIFTNCPSEQSNNLIQDRSKSDKTKNDTQEKVRTERINERIADCSKKVHRSHMQGYSSDCSSESDKVTIHEQSSAVTLEYVPENYGNLEYEDNSTLMESESAPSNNIVQSIELRTAFVRQNKEFNGNSLNPDIEVTINDRKRSRVSRKIVEKQNKDLDEITSFLKCETASGSDGIGSTGSFMVREISSSQNEKRSKTCRKPVVSPNKQLEQNFSVLESKAASPNDVTTSVKQNEDLGTTLHSESKISLNESEISMASRTTFRVPYKKLDASYSCLDSDIALPNDVMRSTASKTTFRIENKEPYDKFALMKSKKASNQSKTSLASGNTFVLENKKANIEDSFKEINKLGNEELSCDESDLESEACQFEQFESELESNDLEVLERAKCPIKEKQNTGSSDILQETTDNKLFEQFSVNKTQFDSKLSPKKLQYHGSERKVSTPEHNIRVDSIASHRNYHNKNTEYFLEGFEESIKNPEQYDKISLNKEEEISSSEVVANDNVSFQSSNNRFRTVQSNAFMGAMLQNACRKHQKNVTRKHQSIVDERRSQLAQKNDQPKTRKEVFKRDFVEVHQMNENKQNASSSVDTSTWATTDIIQKLSNITQESYQNDHKNDVLKAVTQDQQKSCKNLEDVGVATMNMSAELIVSAESSFSVEQHDDFLEDILDTVQQKLKKEHSGFNFSGVPEINKLLKLVGRAERSRKDDEKEELFKTNLDKELQPHRSACKFVEGLFLENTAIVNKEKCPNPLQKSHDQKDKESLLINYFSCDLSNNNYFKDSQKQHQNLSNDIVLRDAPDSAANISVRDSSITQESREGVSKKGIFTEIAVSEIDSNYRLSSPSSLTSYVSKQKDLKYDLEAVQYKHESTLNESGKEYSILRDALAEVLQGFGNNPDEESHLSSITLLTEIESKYSQMIYQNLSNNCVSDNVLQREESVSTGDSSKLTQESSESLSKKGYLEEIAVSEVDSNYRISSPVSQTSHLSKQKHLKKSVEAVQNKYENFLNKDNEEYSILKTVLAEVLQGFGNNPDEESHLSSITLFTEIESKYSQMIYQNLSNNCVSDNVPQCDKSLNIGDSSKLTQESSESLSKKRYLEEIAVSEVDSNYIISSPVSQTSHVSKEKDLKKSVEAVQIKYENLLNKDNEEYSILKTVLAEVLQEFGNNHDIKSHQSSVTIFTESENTNDSNDLLFRKNHQNLLNDVTLDCVPQSETNFSIGESSMITQESSESLSTNKSISEIAVSEIDSNYRLSSPLSQTSHLSKQKNDASLKSAKEAMQNKYESILSKNDKECFFVRDTLAAHQGFSNIIEKVTHKSHKRLITLPTKIETKIDSNDLQNQHQTLLNDINFNDAPQIEESISIKQSLNNGENLNAEGSTKKMQENSETVSKKEDFSEIAVCEIDSNSRISSPSSQTSPLGKQKQTGSFNGASEAEQYKNDNKQSEEHCLLRDELFEVFEEFGNNYGTISLSKESLTTRFTVNASKTKPKDFTKQHQNVPLINKYSSKDLQTQDQNTLNDCLVKENPQNDDVQSIGKYSKITQEISGSNSRITYQTLQESLQVKKKFDTLTDILESVKHEKNQAKSVEDQRKYALLQDTLKIELSELEKNNNVFHLISEVSSQGQQPISKKKEESDSCSSDEEPEVSDVESCTALGIERAQANNAHANVSKITIDILRPDSTLTSPKKKKARPPAIPTTTKAVAKISAISLVSRGSASRHTVGNYFGQHLAFEVVNSLMRPPEFLNDLAQRGAVKITCEIGIFYVTGYLMGKLFQL